MKDMTDKQRKRHLKERGGTYEERLLKDFDNTLDDSEMEENCSMWKTAEWGVMCHQCVGAFYQRLWKENSGIDLKFA